MRIGNSSGFDMAAVLKLQNSHNARPSANTANTNARQAQIQPRPCLAEVMGFTVPHSSAWERNHQGNGYLLPTGLSEEHLDFRQNWQDPLFRANLWLNGIDREGFEEPLGARVFTQLLRESGIELPENAHFDISVDRYGGVTVTGLDNEELTRAIEEATSYNLQMVVTVLAQFVEYERILNGHPPSTTNLGLSVEQQDLFSVQAQLMSYGVDLRNLSLGADGRIQGLPQEINNLLRDNATHFLRNGTAHIPAPNISLTFDSGRMIVNGVSSFNPNNGGGINVTI
jgi:hypothetical protein